MILHWGPAGCRALVVAAVVLGVVACEWTANGDDSRAAADSAARARQDSIVRSQPGYVIDSAISIEESLRRFRADIRDTPKVLVGGERSREALVEKFTRAVERGDSLALRRMAMSRGEFAFLVYPSSMYTRRPYRQQAQITWLLLTAASDKGLRRLVERRAGQPFRFRGLDCPDPPVTEGENRLWRGCAVRRVRAEGDTATERLFGPIIERAGRFKFYSYGNEL